MNYYLAIIIRVVTVLFTLLFSTLFISSKRPVGELPIFSFLCIVIIGAVAGGDITDFQTPHLHTLFAIVLIFTMEKIMMLLSIKSKTINNLLNFEPIIIIQEGKLIYKNIKKSKYTVDEVLMFIREKDVFDISKIKFAILENSGNISIMKNSENLEVTVKDMKVPVKNISLPDCVILDGKLQNNSMKKIGMTEKTLINELKKMGFKDYKDVFYGYIDEHGNLKVSSYKESCDVFEN